MQIIELLYIEQGGKGWVLLVRTGEIMIIQIRCSLFVMNIIIDDFEDWWITHW